MWNRDPSHTGGGYWARQCVKCHRIEALRWYWAHVLDVYFRTQDAGALAMDRYWISPERAAYEHQRAAA